MGQSLSKQEIEWAKAYVTWRSLLKALKKDQTIFRQSAFELNTIYTNFLNHSQALIEQELLKLSSMTIRVMRTDQPTVWEAKVGNHHGYIEVNVIEMLVTFEKLIFNKGEEHSFKGKD